MRRVRCHLTASNAHNQARSWAGFPGPAVWCPRAELPAGTHGSGRCRGRWGWPAGSPWGCHTWWHARSHAQSPHPAPGREQKNLSVLAKCSTAAAADPERPQAQVLPIPGLLCNPILTPPALPQGGGSVLIFHISLSPPPVHRQLQRHSSCWL